VATGNFDSSVTRCRLTLPSSGRAFGTPLKSNVEVQALVRKYNNVVTEIQITMSAIKP